MLRTLRFLPIALAVALVALLAAAPLFIGGETSAASADEEVKLTGDHVSSITHMFLRNHFSRLNFDDEHSREMLDRYLSRFDSGHYYFLQSDIAEFERNATRLDDLIRRGNIDLAFAIHDRFLKRMGEREALLHRLLAEDYDLKSDDTLQVERKDAPYPKDAAEAETLWRKRIKFELLELTLNGETVEQAKEALRKRYRSVHFRFEHYTHNDVVTAFLNAFTSTFDPHSSYLSADDLENFNIAMRLSLEGIGATLRWEDGYTVISSIIPGGAAAREGTLQPEDKIVGVGQGTSGEFEDVTNQRLIDVVKLIRGERGTTVRLAYLRKTKGAVEKRHVVAIVRDKIVLKDGEAKGRLIEHEPTGEDGRVQRVGVIDLPSFYVDFNGRQNDPEHYKSSSRDVERILKGFVEQGVDGVVLDLRNNGGGGLDEAVSLAGLFLNPGPVVMVKDLRGRLSVIRNPHDEPVYKGPLVVLVNRYSASASEIVAGALQDYGRAVIVGDRSTFGKGTVQNIITLPNGLGALKTTVAKFYRPGSASTQNRGVEADVVLPSMNNHMDVGESSLDNALPWDTVRRESFRRWGELEPLLPMLRERSRQRVAHTEYFREVKREIDEYLETRKDRKVVSLKQLVLEHEQGLNGNAEATAAHEPSGSLGEDNQIDPKDDKVLDEAMNVMGDFIRLDLAQRSRALARDSG